jgi:hypothetical protein
VGLAESRSNDADWFDCLALRTRKKNEPRSDRDDLEDLDLRRREAKVI